LFEDYSQALESKDEAKILVSRNKIILHNQPLVTHVINKYFSKTIRSKSTMQDLIQDGCFGLIEAIKRYKPDKGFKFSTYAAWWIRQSVNESLRENESPIVIPPHIINLQNKFNQIAIKEGSSIEEVLENAFLKKEISKKMMLSTIAAISSSKTPLSIDAAYGSASKGDGAVDKREISTVSSNGTASLSSSSSKKKYAMPTSESDFEDDMDKQIMIRSMKNALMNLSDKKRNVLLLRFGIIDEPIATSITNTVK